MSILKAFNNHLKEFMKDIILVFPQDTELKTTNIFLEGLIYSNPSAIIKVWKKHIS